MKGTVKTGLTVNIKPMDGSAQLGVLTGGQYVFGDLSAAGTDLININYYFKVDGTKVNLTKPCKVFIGSNMIVTNETEPGGEPQPVPATIPLEFSVSNGDGNNMIEVSVFKSAEGLLVINVADGAMSSADVVINGSRYIKA